MLTFLAVSLSKFLMAPESSSKFIQSGSFIASSKVIWNNNFQIPQLTHFAGKQKKLGEGTVFSWEMFSF